MRTGWTVRTDPELAVATLERAWNKAKTLCPDRLPAERAKHAALAMHAVMEVFGATGEAELGRRIREHFNVEYVA